MSETSEYHVSKSGGTKRKKSVKKMPIKRRRPDSNGERVIKPISPLNLYLRQKVYETREQNPDMTGAQVDKLMR